jgi:hypothetical protein
MEAKANLKIAYSNKKDWFKEWLKRCYGTVGIVIVIVIMVTLVYMFLWFLWLKVSRIAFSKKNLAILFEHYVYCDIED